MYLIIYLIAGAIVGVIASQIMRANSPLGLLVYIIEGGVGAFLAGYFIVPLLNVGTIHESFALSTLMVTMMGAAAMILIVKAAHKHDPDDRPELNPGQTNRQA